jgi:hypothetical protein
MKVGKIEQQLRVNKIDIGGLSCADRSRVEEIGLRAWLNEQEAPAATVIGKHSDEALEVKQQQKRIWASCVVCDKRFLAERKSAKYCSDRCRVKAQRSDCAAKSILIPANPA